MNTNQTLAQVAWNTMTACTAFDGQRKIASGALGEVAAKAKGVLDRRGERAAVLIFDDGTAQLIEVDFRGSVKAVVSRLPEAPVAPAEGAAPGARVGAEEARGRGRPMLGVVGREVTLLPRHWEWLNGQPGGASVALRKLVEAARKASGEADRKRRAQEAAYRFMAAMAGNEAGFEEATRALFAGDGEGLERRTEGWPKDVREYARRLAREAMGRADGGELRIGKSPNGESKAQTRSR